MQKVCNVLGVLGFVMSGALVGASIRCVCSNPRNDRRHGRRHDGRCLEMIPSEIDAALPELPTTTGPAVPIKSPF